VYCSLPLYSAAVLAEVTLSTSFMFVLVNIVTEKVREDDYTTLLERAKEMGIEEEQLSW
jgi:hypothetical protein